MSLLTTCLCQTFESHSDKILLTDNFSGRSLTGKELLDHSGRIAAALNAKGAGKGSIVPIILPRCCCLRLGLLLSILHPPGLLFDSYFGSYSR